MGRIARILKHAWRDGADTRRAIPPALVQQLTQQVAASERLHSGEIRIYVEAGLPLSYLWRGATPRERAVAMFGKLRVWDTESNNGVLVYLLLAERAIEIVADRGLAARVPAQEWERVVRGMGASFAAGRYGEGLQQAVAAVTQLLVQHFPLAAGEVNPNELPDRPVLG